MSSYAQVISIPREFVEDTIDRFVGAIGELGDARHLIIDARKNLWIDPPGLVTLFMVAARLCERGHPRPRLLLPESKDACAYWTRMGVARHAPYYFDLQRSMPALDIAGHGGSIALIRLPPGPYETSSDPGGTDVRERIRHLTNRLGLEATHALELVVGIEGVAAALLERSDAPVWISAQIYLESRKLGRSVALVALGGDADMSTAAEIPDAATVSPDERDGLVLQRLVLRGMHRFRDPSGRGTEFALLHRAIKRLNGRLTLRSGSARLSLLPSWLDGEPMASGLPGYTGMLVTLFVPQRSNERRTSSRDATDSDHRLR